MATLTLVQKQLTLTLTNKQEKKEIKKAKQSYV